MRRAGQARDKYYPTKRDKDIILVLNKVKAATAKEIASKANLDKSTAYKALGRLHDKGLVMDAAPKKENKHYATCYKLTELGKKYANGLSHIFSPNLPSV